MPIFAPSKVGNGSPESIPLAPRLLVLLAVVLAHLGFLLLYPSSGASGVVAPPARAGDGAVMLTLAMIPPPAISPDTSRPPPSPPAPLTPPRSDVEEPIAHPEDLGLPPPNPDLTPDPLGDPPALRTAAAVGRPDVKCDLAATLRTALQADPQVGVAVASIPPRARSVANAVMVWDGGWVAVGPSANPALDPLREAIVDSIAAAPPDCRDAVNIGPILIPLAGQPGVTILALGSGVWRASDVARPLSVIDRHVFR